MEGQQMNNISPTIAEAIKVWPIVSQVITTLRTEKQYNEAVKLLDTLIDETSHTSSTQHDSLIDLLGTLIEDYENKHISEPQGDAIASLKFFMKEFSLKQSDLPEIGSQGVVSEILNKKRKLNITQIKALSQRFKVSPAVFI